MPPKKVGFSTFPHHESTSDSICASLAAMLVAFLFAAPELLLALHASGAVWLKRLDQVSTMCVFIPQSNGDQRQHAAA